MGVVYVLTNAAMPDLVKIGRTDGTVQDRLKQLNTATGVPLAFELFYAAEVDDPIGWEKALHEAFADRRINPKREFFRLSPDKPTVILKMAHGLVVKAPDPIVDSKEEAEAVSREKSRAAPFNFEMIGLETGARLQSVFNDSQECEVYDSRRVMFRGDICSLSASALTVAHENGFNWVAIQGPNYWKYEGSTLLELKEQGLAEG